MKKRFKALQFYIAIPAFFFHELCHFIAIGLVAPFISKFSISFICKIRRIGSMHLQLTIIQDVPYKWMNAFIACAPRVGFIIAVIVLVVHFPPALFYFIYYRRIFDMSPVDKITFTRCCGGQAEHTEKTKKLAIYKKHYNV